MEGRAAGQLSTLEQHDITPAALDQVVGNAGAADATANDHDPSPVG